MYSCWIGWSDYDMLNIHTTTRAERAPLRQITTAGCSEDWCNNSFSCSNGMTLSMFMVSTDAVLIIPLASISGGVRTSIRVTCWSCSHACSRNWISSCGFMSACNTLVVSLLLEFVGLGTGAVCMVCLTRVSQAARRGWSLESWVYRGKPTAEFST